MTELLWDGNKTGPLRVSLPFQTVETINESAHERQRMLDMFSAGRDPELLNRLIWVDKRYVLPSLLEERGAPLIRRGLAQFCGRPLCICEDWMFPCA
jgi:hypothetical protein